VVRIRQNGGVMGAGYAVLFALAFLGVYLGEATGLDFLTVVFVILAFVGMIFTWYKLPRSSYPAHYLQPTTPKAQELTQQLNRVRLMSGTQFEHFVSSLFRSLGYRAKVMGGAGDQGVDIVLRRGDESIAVQCKNYAKPVGNQPVQEVYAGARHHGCSTAWVVAPAGFTSGAIELAKSVGVSL
jgi:HJR/Mrr/RecB family endonuclease